MRTFISILTTIIAIVAFVLYWYVSESYKETIFMLVETVEQRNEQLTQYHEAHSLLQRYYDQIGSDYEQLAKDYNRLHQDYTQSQQEVANLEQHVLGLERQVTSLEQVEVTLRNQITTNKEYYQQQIEMAREEAEEAKFIFYYVPMEQRYGVNDLQDYLQRGEWKEGAYVEGKFDCSQMSTFLEWKLENEGYHTVIVGGDSPDGSGRHAWLLVETSKGKYMPVEATAYSIVYWSYPYFDNYFEYEFRFETIHEALVYSPTEFNWWD